MAQSHRIGVKYIYDLPYMERMELCRILDQNDKWEILGGIHMGFDMLTIQALRRCRGPSPTDELLTKWGHQNHTILELFVHLSRMQHYQAMLIIKKFIDPEYHKLIYEGEENINRLFRQASLKSQSDQHKSTISTGTDVNLNVSRFVPNGDLKESKILNVDNTGTEKNLPTPSASPTPMDNPKGETSRTRSEASGVDAGGPPQILFKELELATNGWDPQSILGKGGFGTVYKGMWKNTPVAIKRTRNPETDESHTVQMQQILGELRMLNACRHDNILPLYGYSIGGEDPCLIYQFMPNGSLEDRLLCRQNTAPLSWQQRLVIAIGTARGLQFLHTINEKPLIHGDIKSANILLDSNFQPKIGDFGLAREGPQNHYTHMKVSRVHGTRPYLPDEFLRAKKFSTKVDTHSFGVVLFEIATGLRAYDDQRRYKFLRELIENTTELETLVDRKCEPEEPNTLAELVELGKCCVQKRAKDRPEMVFVLRELEALSANRDIRIRAKNVRRQPSPNPANPYELQEYYDHKSEKRSTNGDFCTRETGAASNIPSIAVSPPSENVNQDEEVENSFNTEIPYLSVLGAKGQVPHNLQSICDNSNNDYLESTSVVTEEENCNVLDSNIDSRNSVSSDSPMTSFEVSTAMNKAPWVV